jgi:hypothetical protein
MPTQIDQIFANLISWQFSINGQVITTPSLQQIEDNPAPVYIPYRVVSPALNRAEGEVEGSTFGDSYQIKWAIDDLLLWRAVGEIPSFADSTLPLLQYEKLFLSKWVRNRQITPNAYLETIKPFTAGVFEYPAGMKQWYYGILATHHIKEYVSDG